MDGSVRLVDGHKGLYDGKTYYWKIEAVDCYGNMTASAVWSFTTKNTNVPPGIITGIVYSDRAMAFINQATVSAMIGNQVVASAISELNGFFALEVNAGTVDQLVIEKTGFETASISNVTVTTDETARVNPNITPESLPNAPAVSGTTPTNNLKPTWTWASGGSGGNGTYRFKLNSSDLTTGATETTATSYTPASNLTEGSHTLYVQERDAAGNWSASGSNEITVGTTKGDINGDTRVNLADAIIALQMISHMNPSGIRLDYATSGADVNRDGRIGMAEVIYILQKAAGLR
jgi:hypothetical protein